MQLHPPDAEDSDDLKDSTATRDWWRDAAKQGYYPWLVSLSELLLCIPPSSLWQERHFSHSGRRVHGLSCHTSASTIEWDNLVSENYERIKGRV